MRRGQGMSSGEDEQGQIIIYPCCTGVELRGNLMINNGIAVIELSFNQCHMVSRDDIFRGENNMVNTG